MVSRIILGCLELALDYPYFKGTLPITGKTYPKEFNDRVWGKPRLTKGVVMFRGILNAKSIGWLPIFALFLMVSANTVTEIRGSTRCGSIPKPQTTKEESKEFAVISVSSKSVRIHVGQAVENPFGKSAELKYSEAIINPLGTKLVNKKPITNNDLQNCVVAVSDLVKKGLELGIVQTRVYVIIASSLSDFKEASYLKELIEQLNLSVEILTPRQEAGLAIKSICPNPVLANDCVHVDLGSGSIKIAASTSSKGNFSINATSLEGISALENFVKNAIKEGVSFEKALQNRLIQFDEELDTLFTANPALSNRRIILCSGGIPYVLSLTKDQTGANKNWCSVSKDDIKTFSEKLSAAKSVEHFASKMDHEDKLFVSNNFSLNQLSVGSAVMNSMSKVFKDKPIFIAKNISWELFYGLDK